MGSIGLEKWLSGLTILSFGLLTMLVIGGTRRPYCIDSNIIEKISYGGDLALFKCSLNRVVSTTGYLAEKPAYFFDSALSVEKFLNQISPFRSRLHLDILPFSGPTYQFLYHFNSATLTVNQNVFETPGVLEKTLIKTWLRDQNAEYFLNDLLAEEIFSDFILSIAQGQLQVSDALSASQLSLEHQKWPQILKNVSGYCRSDWKIAEHYQMCANLNRMQGPVGDEMIDFSLRPFLSTSWIQVYQQLTLQEKMEVVKSLPSLLRSLRTSEDFYLNALQSSQTEPWMGPFLTVKRLNSLWSSSHAFLSTPTYRHILANLASQLEQRGFKELIEIAEFDLVYQSDWPLDRDSPRVQNLIKLAQKNPTLRILIKDPEKIWFAPAPEPISANILKGFRAHRVALETCSKVDFTRVISYADATSKLLVIRNCQPQTVNNLKGYTLQGAEGFALDNPTISFVHFHLPSVLLKKDELLQAGDVFRFVGQRKIDNPSFQSLGWRELDWNDRLKTFHPRGYIDAIELFRVSTQEKPSISNL